MKLKNLFAAAMLLGLSGMSAGLMAQTPTAGEEIDMGVSVMWRGYNLGAETPSGKGTKYAFASTVVGGYKAVNSYPFYDTSSQTFSLPSGFSGNVEYDAAAATTNGKWRIPTKAEWEELLANCTISGDLAGGFKLKSKTTGNVLLLPSITAGNDDICSYYSADSDGSKPYVASFGSITSKVSLQYVSIDGGYGPWVGYPIRPVCEKYSGPALEQINLSIEKSEIYVGTSTTITATSVPADVPMKLTYSSSNQEVATVSDAGVVMGISAGEATITVASDGISATIKVVVKAAEASTDEEYVDLGLSVEWCSHNIGAQTPYEKGTLYPFAYIEPTTITISRNYKFYKNSSYSFPKVNMIGDPAYDAITKNAAEGSEERLPSEAEIKELVDNCEVKYNAADGDIAEHIKITSRINGRSIILPLHNTGKYGTYYVYYSGSANAEKNMAVVLEFNKSKSAISVGYSSSPWQSNTLRGVRGPIPQIELESIQLNKTEATIYAENTVSLTAKPLPTGAEFTDLKWTSADDNIATVVNGLVKGVSAGTVLITATDGKVSASATITVKEVVLSEGEAIDMGGDVLWASCELGSTSPSIPGDRYSWGATTPNVGDTEATWTDPGIKEISGTEYDAAHVNLGNGWRMPTRSEITKLVMNVSTEWLTYKGQSGVVLTSNITGAKIFCPLPKNLNYIAYFGDYIQDGSLSSDQKPSVESAYITKGMCDLSSEKPWKLLPMRPVKSKIPALESIALDKTEISIVKGESAQLSATPVPAEAIIESPVWTSENQSVATVSGDGLVTAVDLGETNVTITSGTISASAKIIVTSSTGVEDITVTSGDSEIYTIDGIRVGRISEPGIYIIRRADGSVTKQIVR